MTQANDRERVPAHYASPYLHWDLVLATGMGYFEGNATKYISRWRKKGGLDDLEKACHYIQKLMENAYLTKQPRHLSIHAASVGAEVHRFAEANGMTSLEERIVREIAAWQYVIDLVEVPSLLRQLATPAPVPLTEENHYSPRVGEPDPEEDN